MARFILLLCLLGLVAITLTRGHPRQESEQTSDESREEEEENEETTAEYHEEDEEDADNDEDTIARWCVISQAEYYKCEDFSRILIENGLTPRIKCVISADAEGCLYKIRENEADLVTLDGGDVFRAGRAFEMKPIMKEIYTGGSTGYYGIAVVLANNTGVRLTNLRGKRTCHTGIGRTAGWNIPIGYLLKSGQMPSLGCKESPKSAGHFFNASCAPGALLAEKNPYDDNPPNLCAQCKGDCSRSSDNEPYNGYSGAFRCMIEGNGDIAFIKPATIEANLGENRPAWARDIQTEDLRILCKDGTVARIEDAENCHISKGVSHAVLTSGEASEEEVMSYQNLLTQAVEMFASDTDEDFTMFDSTVWGGRNLMFKDYAQSMERIDIGTTSDDYLGGYGEGLEGLNKCPDGTLRFCTISQQEQLKCRAMREAFLDAELEPEISCFPSASHANCIDDIKAGFADIVVLDGGDIYRAGKDHGLQTILGEVYGTDKQMVSYWAVAVVKANTDFTINDLRGKRSCHTGIMKTSGWIMPVSYLVSNDFITVEDSVPDAVGAFFNSSCAPGAKSSKYDLLGTNPENLCENCVGKDDDKCARSDHEPYYDYSGAFRCLVENAGDVAFVKHTTVRDNTGINTPEDWDLGQRRKIPKKHFKLLCPDGTRKSHSQFRYCNLGKVPSHAMMTSGNKSKDQLSEISRLFRNAAKIFKSDDIPGFKLFDSSGFEKDGEMIYYLDMEGQSGKNLLFKDSTVDLRDTTSAKRSYDKWLGNEYLDALELIQ